MNTELISLSKIFSENLFRIPDYQRGYSWTDRHIRDFWNDIQLLEDGKDHYTGVLTLEAASKTQCAGWDDDAWIIESKRFTAYYVVDGQQRLTTSLILLQCIIERIDNDSGTLNYTTVAEIRKKFIFDARPNDVSRTYIFGYEKDNPSREFLKTRIFLERSDEHSVGEETIYTQNLLKAKMFFCKELGALSDIDVGRVYQKLTQHFMFNIYTMSADINVFVAFETMNNRGKPLSDLEILKSRLIFLATRMPAEENDIRRVRHTVNEVWKTVYHYLGKNKDNPLDDDLYLSTHFLLYFGSMFHVGLPYRHYPHLQREFLFDRIFTSKNIEGFAEKAAQEPIPSQRRPDYAGRIASSGTGETPIPRVTIELIHRYAGHLKNSVECYYRLHNPADSDLPDVDKVALARLKRLGWLEANALVLAALRARSAASEKAFSDLLRGLEILAFRRLLFDRARAPFESDFDKMAIEMEADRTKLIEHATAIRKASGETYTVEERIPTGNVSAFGYYRWHGLAYLLFEYEMELKKKARSSRDKIDWREFINEDFEGEYSTIEHIYPLNPSSDLWGKEFAALPQKQRASLRNSLGNLVPLSKAKNKALGNRDFKTKCEGTAEFPGYKVGSYSEIEVARSADWTPDSIAERGLRILRFAEKRWHMNFGDKPTQLRLLGLNFLAK